MIRSIALLLALAIPLLSGCEKGTITMEQDKDREEWIQLFDGESLNGWIPKIRGEEAGSDSRRTFRVEDGVIKVDYSEYESFDGQFGHLFYETPFSHYRLNVLYRFTGEQLPDGPGWAYRNSGLMLHGQAPETMGIDQDFPISIEVQLLGGNGQDERTTANLCTPGTHVEMDGALETRHCISASSPTFHGDEWVEVEVVVLGDSLIAHAVEGDPVLAYQKPQVGGGNVDGHDPAVKIDGTLLALGTISLQSESHPVEFKRVELMNLSGCMDPRASNYRWWYEHSDPGTCVYD
ncbi:MAG: DUF1080 domain-containing protein [Rhodothermales bacterium]|nr:DUF1080 domain-containing protein [Rhodothermales bacterium]